MALPVFPTLSALGWPVKRPVNWNTVKQDAQSGKRTRVPLYSYPTYSYELTINALSSAAIAFGGLVALEWQTLLGFINSVQGPAQLWAYNDPNDNSATNQDFGTGNGTATAFQLVRSLGGFTEPVFLVNGTPVIEVAGSPTTPTSISPYGVVNFSSPPANGAALTWSGFFYWPCRFDDDSIEFSNFMSTLAEIKSLKFSTEKLP
jgi:uncharacterized protein (TIGR02217 family)